MNHFILFVGTQIVKPIDNSPVKPRQWMAQIPQLSLADVHLTIIPWVLPSLQPDDHLHLIYTNQNPPHPSDTFPLAPLIETYLTSQAISNHSAHVIGCNPTADNELFPALRQLLNTSIATDPTSSYHFIEGPGTPQCNMVMKLLLEFHSKTLKYRVLQAIEGAEGPVEKVQYQLKLGFVLQQCLQLVRFGNYGPARLLLHENKHERTRKMLVCMEYLEMRWACQAIEKLKGNTISDPLLRKLGAEEDLLMRSALTPEVPAATWFGSPNHFWTVRIRLERAVFGFQNRSLGTGQAVLDLHIFLETTIDLLSLHVLNIDHGLTYEQKTQAIEQRFVDTFKGTPVAQFLNKRSIPQTIVALLGVCNQPELHAFLTSCMQLHNAFSRNTGEQTEVCPPFATPLGMIVPKAPTIPLNEWRNKVAHEGKPYQRRDTQLAEDWAMQIAPHFWSERDHFYLRVNRALERSWA